MTADRLARHTCRSVCLGASLAVLVAALAAGGVAQALPASQNVVIIGGDEDLGATLDTSDYPTYQAALPLTKANVMQYPWQGATQGGGDCPAPTRAIVRSVAAEVSG